MVKIILTGKCPFCQSYKTGIIITGNYSECIRLKYRYLSRGMLCKVEKPFRVFGHTLNNRFCAVCGAEWKENDRKKKVDDAYVSNMRGQNGITDEQLMKLKAHINFQEYMDRRKSTLFKAFLYYIHMRRIVNKEKKKVGENYV